MKYNEKTIKSEYIYINRVIKLREDLVVLENEKETNRVIIEHNGGAAGLAITNDLKILFVKQFRKPFEESLLELPAGKIEIGDGPDETMIREFYEEVGVKTKKVEKIGIMYPTPGYSNEVIHLYFTNDFERIENKLDEDEFLDVIEVGIKDAYNMVDSGKIVDAKTLIILLKLKERLIKLLDKK